MEKTEKSVCTIPLVAQSARSEDGKHRRLFLMRFLPPEDYEDITGGFAMQSACPSSQFKEHHAKAWCFFVLGRNLPKSLPLFFPSPPPLSYYFHSTFLFFPGTFPLPLPSITRYVLIIIVFSLLFPYNGVIHNPNIKEGLP